MKEMEERERIRPRQGESAERIKSIRKREIKKCRL